MLNQIRMRRSAMQLELPLRHGRGGRRAGAGRRRRSDEHVPHLRRPAFAGARHPLHVTIRVRRDVWNLRSQRGYRCVERALAHERGLGELRVVHYSVQSNHLHLVAEAPHRRVLARRMQGFGVRLAKALNRMMRGRRGRVFAERYHARALTTPREVRNVLRYVLGNAARHHGGPQFDPFSSASAFDGWRAPPPPLRHPPGTGPPPVARARTWLLTKGWRTHGLLDPRDTPRPSACLARA